MSNEHLLSIRRDITEPLEDPRKGETFEGMPFTLGDTIEPDPSNYPGWELTPIHLENGEKDGWIFALAPYAITPAGCIERPPDLAETEEPIIVEYLVQGSGWLVLEDAGGHLVFEEVDSKRPIKVRYGERACVAYLAGEDGLVGINTGEPPGIPETNLSDGHEKATEEFWNLYRRMQREHHKYDLFSSLVAKYTSKM